MGLGRVGTGPLEPGRQPGEMRNYPVHVPVVEFGLPVPAAPTAGFPVGRTG